MPDMQLWSAASHHFPRLSFTSIFVVQQLTKMRILDCYMCETRVGRKKAVDGNGKVSLPRWRFTYIFRVKRERKKEELEEG